jgi:alkylation response protein AidB-like acyl-CoA dehydrogenase
VNLDFSEEQEVLRDTVRKLCAEASPLDVVRALEDDPKGVPEALWKQMGELGLLGVLIPEAFGGSEQTLLEAVIVFEVLGRALAPTPAFESAVMSAGVLRAAGSEAQQQEWLPRIASGEAIVTPAWMEPQRGFGPEGVSLRAKKAGKSFVLSGTKRFVTFAAVASRLLVLARTGKKPEDVSLFLVDPQSAGLSMKQLKSLASDTQYEVTFEDVKVPGDALVGKPNGGWATGPRPAPASNRPSTTRDAPNPSRTGGKSRAGPATPTESSHLPTPSEGSGAPGMPPATGK